MKRRRRHPCDLPVGETPILGPHFILRAHARDVIPTDEVMVAPSHWVRWDALSEPMQRVLRHQARIWVRRPRRPRISTIHHSSHGRKKIQHRCWLSAWWHALRLTHTKDGVWKPYPCRWGDIWQEGPSAPLHWHAGRVGRVAVHAKEVRHGK